VDELRDEEMRIREAAAVEIAALVDRDAVDRELEVLALPGVEAAQVDALG
jgi:hypothetical protein